MKEDTTNRTLKILLDDDFTPSTKNSNIERWENEGGAAVASKPVWSAGIPLRKGEIFEVKDIKIQYENDRAYCFIEIELLSL